MAQLRSRAAWRACCGWLVCCCWLLIGCGALPGVRSDGRHVQEHEVRCARATMGKNSPYRMPLAPPVSDPAALAVLDVLPPEARHVARAGGLEPLLVELLRAPPQADSPDAQLAARMSRYELQQEVTLRLIALETQAQSLAFETACTRQRVGQLVRTLDRQEGERQLSLAATSLLVGAITGTVAGVWDLTAQRPTHLPATIAITGGIATAGLGASALLQPTRTLWLEHAHNLLRPMADGVDPEHLYPSFVFRMLTVQYPGDSTTTRALLLGDFAQRFAELSPWVREHASHTLLSEGGVYDRDLLQLREELLRVLESAVQGVARDLELLMRSLVKLLAQPSSGSPALVWVPEHGWLMPH